jgi:hypothetical protein
MREYDDKEIADGDEMPHDHSAVYNRYLGTCQHYLRVGVGGHDMRNR